MIVAWLLMQMGDTLAPALHLPEWINSALAFFIILGFPLALVFAWAFEMTPDGLKREKEIDRTSSVSTATGQKLNLAVITLLSLAVIYFVFERVTTDAPQEDQVAQVATDKTEAGPTPVKARADSKSIAVLPFANRSNVADDLFFTDGIHDDLLTQLAKVDDLKVISRTSVMEYRDTSKKIPEIANELGVATILEGGIQRAGKRIRINAQLIDVETDEHLWAETFDREMTVENIFDIQSEITRQIVTAVRGELSSEEIVSLNQLPTENLDAYEAYMHAKAAMNESAYTAEKYLKAQEWAERAVKLDPDFTWAWAILAETNGHAIWIGFDSSAERAEAAKYALDQAMAKNANSAEAKTALASYLYRIKGDYTGALDALQKVSRMNPGDARTMFLVGSTQRRIGQFDEAIASFEKALRLDPLNGQTLSDYLLTLMYNAEYEKGVRLAEDAIQRFPEAHNLKSHLAFMYINWKGDLSTARALLNDMTPRAGFEFVTLATRLPLYERDFDQALAVWDLPEVMQYSSYGSSPSGWRGVGLGQIHLLLGNPQEASEKLETFISNQSSREILSIRNRALTMINIALAYALTDQPQKALETMEEAKSIIALTKDGLAGAMLDGSAARVLALAGEHERALKEVERLIDTPGSTITRWNLTLDPRWDFFRDNARFNELIRPVNDP